MKVIITAVLCTLASIISDQAVNEASFWTTDFDRAKQTAKQSDKDILLVFSGSDWCGPCIKLDNEIWMSEVFQAYAKKEYIMVKADFPRKKKNALPAALQEQNGLLAERYNPQGYFPLVLRLDHDGNVLGKTGYKSITPAEYIKVLDQFSK